MRHVFIVNPLAGGGKSLKIVKNIARVCQEEELDFIIHYTKNPMDATKITESYKESQCIIYSVGGDGTMNEVVNGIIGSKNLFAVIPAGSGNDFNRTLEGIDKLEFLMDVGKINDRYFVNVACIGIDGDIADNAHEIMKKVKIPPTQIYNISIVYTFIKYKLKELELKLNEFYKKDKFTLLAICNGRYYGGGFNIAPNAQLCDGLFDIYFVNKVSKLKIPFCFLKLIKGTHENLAIITKKQSEYVVINSAEEVVCNVDGESIKGKKFKISVIRNGVKIYNNKELINKFLSPGGEVFEENYRQAT